MSVDEVPVVSIRDLDSPGADAEVASLIDYACREWGFFQITDHGIDPAVIEAMREQMQRFFRLATREKREIIRTQSNPWGFFDEELTKNHRDWKEIFDFGPAFTHEDETLVEPQWPRQLPAFKPAMQAFYAACERLSFRILGVVARNLGVEPDRLAGEFEGEHTSFLRLNYYPPCPNPESPPDESEPNQGHLGINRHTDAGALTLLLQDQQPGLQVLHHGEWRLVRPVENAITVNIGDIVQVWSNDEYRAAVHRVLANPDAERFSAPFFFNPAYRSDYKPLPSMIDDDNPPQYRSINWGDFRAARAAGDYADYGDEVQISDYRIA